MEDLKQQYNNLLIRHYRATTFLDNQEIPLEAVMKHLDEYKLVSDKLDKALVELKKLGVSYSDHEIENGFLVGDEAA